MTEKRYVCGTLHVPMMYIYEDYIEPRSYELTSCLCSLRFPSSCWKLLQEPLSEDQEPGLNGQVAMSPNSPAWSLNIHTHTSEQDTQYTTVRILLPLCVSYRVCSPSVCAITRTTRTDAQISSSGKSKIFIKFQTDLLCNNRKIIETPPNPFLYSQTGD